MSKFKFSHIVLIFISLFLILTFVYYQKTREVAINNAHEKINELLLNYKAFRTYVSKIQKEEVYKLEKQGHIPKGYFSPKLLSSTYSAKGVNDFYNKFRIENGQEPILIRFASDHPRNTNNLANDKESIILTKFNNDKNLKEYEEIITQNNKTILYFAVPTKRTTNKCMRCHSDPALAPSGLVDIYGSINGFHEKEGKIRAILSTAYPLDKDLEFANKIFYTLTLITFIMASLGIYVMYRFMHKIEIKNKNLNILNKTLDHKVDKRTKELKEEKEYIKTIIESNNNAIIAINWHGEITTYNKKAQEMFGWTKEEMLGKRNLLNIIPDKYKKDHISGLANYLKTGKLHGTLDNSKQVEAIHKDGTIFPIRISIGSKFKSLNTIIIANISDITEEIKHETALLKSEKLASMGEMIGNIAHQWRQPLSVISTAATGIIMQKEFNILDETKLIKTCHTINDNAQYLSKTIDDFKNFIKGDTSKKRFILEEAINSFLHLIEGSIKQYNLTLILDCQKDITIDGYKNELQQCLINIFNNSKDALIENNNINNRYIFISTFVQNNNALIKVKDNAGGIPVNIINKIFEPYFTTKHKSQGTGLGLNMTYNLIVDGMKGNIEVKNNNFTYNNKEQSGAEFIIILPIN